MAFKFEELRVWQKSVQLTSLIDVVADEFPKKELYSLSSQIRRAADSVSLNIAEGSTGQTNPEFKRFLGMSLRSGIEVIGCIYLAKERKIISESNFKQVYDGYESLITSIQALRKSL
ncbi:MAG TPA: four helix bundle protein [Chitinophagales bacterium]|nr:four helix bundle protein [Chitinophagales bacterium]